MKTILLTGATDGLGLEAAKVLITEGHNLILHGRNPEKLERAKQMLSGLAGDTSLTTCQADLSRLSDVTAMTEQLASSCKQIDVLINNAGVFRTSTTVSDDGLDVRFAVNTVAPYMLAQNLKHLIPPEGRIVNLSSAAQAPVNLRALYGDVQLDDFEAYAQSKLAITMWSRALAAQNPGGPVMIALNPGSMLGTKMVQKGFGVEGGDIRIGADIISRAALSDTFSAANGQYFDNDARAFANPHPAALDDAKCKEVVDAIEDIARRTRP